MDTIRRKNAQKVICAMSGGVDSSVAAALLKRSGFDVIGVFMKFWLARRSFSEGGAGFNRCCSAEAENRARKVARILKIPFYVFNFEKEFKRKIVDYFLKECKAGRTPNPCIICNKEIKFGLLLEKALKFDTDYVATGHYARINRGWKNLKKNPPGEKVKLKLLKGKDKEKDQSYFLWQLNQKQLKHILFPIGDYTRKEVEGLAKKFKLPILSAKKSVEICFIKTTINDFLKKYLKGKPGDIVSKEGKVLGQHQGLWFYTIGQRKGIGLAGGPYFVLNKDFKKNLLVVTKNEKDLYGTELIAKNINWISPKQSLRDATGQAGKEPKLPLKVKAKIRYRTKFASAKIYPLIPNSKFLIRFLGPQRAVTPGQSVVFYKGREVLGGGIIET